MLNRLKPNYNEMHPNTKYAIYTMSGCMCLFVFVIFSIAIILFNPKRSSMIETHLLLGSIEHYKNNNFCDANSLTGLLYYQNSPIDTTACGANLTIVNVSAVSTMKNCREDAIAILANDLKSSDTQRRRASVYALIKLDAIDPIGGLVADNDIEIRQCAKSYMNLINNK